MCKKNFLTICIVGLLIMIVFLFVYFPWVVLPTYSSPHMLTLVDNGGPHLESITMRYWQNNALVAEYELDLKIELHHQQPQKYMLPEMKEGQVEFIANFGVGNDNNDMLMVKYSDAKDLHDRGMLVYLTTDFDSFSYADNFVCYEQFVYFISGEENTIFIKNTNSSKWKLTADAPHPKRISKQAMGYSPLYYGWKENEWNRKF